LFNFKNKPSKIPESSQFSFIVIQSYLKTLLSFKISSLLYLFLKLKPILRLKLRLKLKLKLKPNLRQRKIRKN
jgi:hypothetical protein